MVSGSYMTWNTPMICMTSIRENMPEMEGRVMFQNLRNTPAPSIMAAS